MPEENTTDQDAAAQEANAEKDVENTTAAAAQTGDEDAADESRLDGKAKAALEKVRREAHNLRQRLKELEPAARKLKEIEDKDKSESQKLAEQLAEMQKKIGEYETREVRVAAAAAAGLPANMAQFITATDPDEAKTQAKQLAEFGKSGQQTDFKQGARKVAPQKISEDDWLRKMAGRQQ
jgi:iron-sulfur cluster repair protein YtfE (RIC family)